MGARILSGDAVDFACEEYLGTLAENRDSKMLKVPLTPHLAAGSEEKSSNNEMTTERESRLYSTSNIASAL